MKIIAPDPNIPRRHIHGALGDASGASQRRLHSLPTYYVLLGKISTTPGLPFD